MYTHRIGSITVQYVACTESWSSQTSVVGVIEMENIAPGVVIEPTSLPFWNSVLTHYTT